MPDKQVTQTANAPAAIGPYSQAVRAGNTIYLSGSIPLDPESGLVVEGDITAQARRAFENMRAIVEASGATMEDVVRVGLYVTNMGDFAAVNAVMAEYFNAPFPARSTVEVSALPRGVMVEVDGIVVLD